MSNSGNAKSKRRGAAVRQATGRKSVGQGGGSQLTRRRRPYGDSCPVKRLGRAASSRRSSNSSIERKASASPS
jgi:hypothetical protein